MQSGLAGQGRVKRGEENARLCLPKVRNASNQEESVQSVEFVLKLYRKLMKLLGHRMHHHVVL